MQNAPGKAPPAHTPPTMTPVLGSKALCTEPKRTAPDELVSRPYLTPSVRLVALGPVQVPPPRQSAGTEQRAPGLLPPTQVEGLLVQLVSVLHRTCSEYVGIFVCGVSLKDDLALQSWTTTPSLKNLNCAPPSTQPPGIVESTPEMKIDCPATGNWVVPSRLPFRSVALILGVVPLLGEAPSLQLLAAVAGQAVAAKHVPVPGAMHGEPTRPVAGVPQGRPLPLQVPGS